MSKGDETRSEILKQALDLASQVGLEGLTIGSLAKRVGMSKSGLYAHFGSKEELQTRVLDTAAEIFTRVVLTKAFKKPRGVPRIRAIFDIWLEWYSGHMSGGCPFIAAAAELDDRPGPVREKLVNHLQDVTRMILRAAKLAVKEGHFRRDLDLEQFAFEFWAIILAYHYYARLLHHEEVRERADRAFRRLLKEAEEK